MESAKKKRNNINKLAILFELFYFFATKEFLLIIKCILIIHVFLSVPLSLSHYNLFAISCLFYQRIISTTLLCKNRNRREEMESTKEKTVCKGEKGCHSGEPLNVITDID